MINKQLIIKKNKEEINKMRRVGLLAAAQLLDYLEVFIKPGITTLEINDLADKWISDKGAISACLGYNNFPKSLCTSINHVVCVTVFLIKPFYRTGIL